MYRYRFNIKTAMWEIQLLWLGLIWRTVKTDHFTDLDKATKFVRERGIDKYYKMQESPAKFSLGNGCSQ